AQCQVVDAWDAHRSRFRVEARCEVAEGVDAPADLVLCLEDDRLVALTGKLERGDEAGDSASDDDDALGQLRPSLQALGRDAQGGVGEAATGQRTWLAGFGQLIWRFGRRGRGVSLGGVSLGRAVGHDGRPPADWDGA